MDTVAYQLFLTCTAGGASVRTILPGAGEFVMLLIAVLVPVTLLLLVLFVLVPKYLKWLKRKLDEDSDDPRE